MDDMYHHALKLLSMRDYTAAQLREKLEKKFGRVDENLIAEELGTAERPSLREVLNATMIDCKLRAPLHPRDAARLFRALSRLGYQEDAIREELEPLHEQ